MSLLSLAATIALAASTGNSVTVGPGQGHGRDQDAAFRATQKGHILPLNLIRSRIRIPGAQFIGAELDEAGTMYRLKYMRGNQVIWLDIDARTGRLIAHSGH